jgi:3',5'-cyclic AMP phosphodiesterase CpdA
MLIAHVSDLHIGRDAATDRSAHLLAASLEDAGVSTAIVTGDVTHRGRDSEMARFEAAFRRIRSHSRLVVVPGNHDRLTEDAGRRFMPCARVDVISRPGLYVIRLDSTGPHNRRLLASHGLLSPADLGAVDSALDSAPEGSLTALALHHHLLPLPADAVSERISDLFGWPFATELRLGAELLRRIAGRCDLVLHGHRHAPSELVLGADTERPLRVLNAGSTPELGRFRVISSRAGRPGTADWIEVEGDGSLPLAGAPVGVAA